MPHRLSIWNTMLQMSDLELLPLLGFATQSTVLAGLSYRTLGLCVIDGWLWQAGRHQLTPGRAIGNGRNSLGSKPEDREKRANKD
ncbi:hypothetical protein BDV26DRAFT_264291 [Aspergillus bertholletiae]|uniref:Uncharacterized protein n=1 Tax=Aspergillus bertholletiae TaxID=1226010 RepID=A0A5N7B6Z0_9EURO|nr:hypothetical protein BDV26DRAFT_264291 [Aspergillus bertholletiae]